MKKFIKRLLRGNGSKQLTQESEPINVDPSPKPIKTKNSTSSETSQRSGEIICPNKRCGKTISNPVELTDLSQDQSGTYLACPYCMTRLPIATAEQKGSAKRDRIEKPASPKRNDSEKTKSTGKCNQYFGYLRERPKDAPIPNECLTCPKLVECLLG